MSHEQPGIPELDESLVQAYGATFIPRTDLYARQLAHGRYVCVKESLDISLVRQHLLGEVTLGAYALDPASQAKWLCFDADDATEWQAVRAMAQVLVQQAVTPYLEPSRRGGHLWLFLPPLPGQDARRVGQWLSAPYGLDTVELYPKQDRLVTGPGSFVRLPLGVHRKSGRRYHFVTLDGEPLAPTIREQIRLLAEPVRVPDAFIDQALDQIPEFELPAPTPAFTPPSGEVPGETVSQRVKNAISVRDFVSHYVALDERGTGLCPFHEDQHQSFGVNESGNYWNCWAGCGGGSIIDFWSKWREVHGQSPDFTETVTELAQMLLP